MSDRVFAATRKGLFRFDRGETGWTLTERHFLGDRVELLLADPRDGSVYACLNHGHFGCKLHRSTDGGASFDEVGIPTYPEPPDDWDASPPFAGAKVAPWKLIKVWSMAHGGADRPGRLWAGTIPGGLFRSDDHGATWELCRPLWDHESRRGWFGGGEDHAGIHSICVDPRDSDVVRVAISCGGVWETRDAGASWTQRAHGMFAEYMPPDQRENPDVQDPHCMVQCAGAPERLWCQHHNAVFRSDDSGASWQVVEAARPSVFGFTVAVHPAEPDTAWFVPAVKDEQRIPVDGQVVVGRTRDGGETFDVLRDGLPQQDAYDITFRHGLDVDETGDRVAFGSTTGSLWLSEDQGDHWTALSEHLPQVYCVRFGSSGGR